MKREDAIRQALDYKKNRDELIGERYMYEWFDPYFKHLSKAIGELARDIRDLMECYNFTEEDMEVMYNELYR